MSAPFLRQAGADAAALFGIVSLRYLVTSAVPYLLLNVWGDARWRARRISERTPQPGLVRHDIAYSIVSCAIFAGFGALLIWGWRSGAAKIYTALPAAGDPLGWAYLPLSFALFALAHETYFYWTHRWLHRPEAFRRFHSVHHRSRQPTAWTSFSFHPVEAAIQAAFVPALCFLVPIHVAVLFAFLLFMTALGVINHLGYELYPREFARHPFWRHWVSATHHQLHHERVSGNLGLYFTFWDRWLGTHHADYERLYRAGSAPRTLAPAPNAPLVIVGAGLWGGLLASRVLERDPAAAVILLDSQATSGGNHTWSFHESDVAQEQMAWLAPWVSRSWEGYDVKFPSFSRELPGRYHSIRSADFRRQLAGRLGSRLQRGSQVATLEPFRVQLTDGRWIDAKCVIDARGAAQRPSLATGYQKFVGLDLKLAAPHGLERPVLMDATVAQLDGYRFVYLLPWGERELLVEDTRYSSFPSLDIDALAESVLAYAAARGWKVSEISRMESGVLPIPMEDPTAPDAGPVPAIGMRAGIFHDTTGYSLPDAVRLADRLARAGELTPERARAEIHAYVSSRAISRKFLRALNRMLFLGARPEHRYRVLEHFYRLPPDTIRRFYAGELGARDAARLLIARPPVPVGRAIAGVLGIQTATPQETT